ncbi:MAG: nicotinate-nucleotide adenylyltransferase [bacterium]
MKDKDNNKNKKLKIGIMGGTFNPIHNTHIDIAEKAMEMYKLDKVLFITTGQPPHKEDIYVEEAKHRHKMVKLAISDNKKFKASKMEIKRKKTTYTIDTLKELHEIYKSKNKEVKLYFITGTDAVANLHKWKDADNLFKYSKFLVVERPDYKLDKYNLKEEARGFLKKHSKYIKYFDFTPSHLSSTEVRELIKNQADFDDDEMLICREVKEYIIENDLYNQHAIFMSKYKALLRQLEPNLNENRFKHSIEVSKEAVKMGKHYNLSDEQIEKLFLAGILHDCAKCLTKEEILENAEIYNLELDDFVRNRLELAHSFLGEFIAKYEYSMITDGDNTIKLELIDEDVLGAIRYHTTGVANMFTIEKIIYIADYIEPTRRYFEGLIKARELAYKDLDRAMEYILDRTIEYNKGLGGEVHPLSIEAYEFYKNKNNKNNKVN